MTLEPHDRTIGRFIVIDGGNRLAPTSRNLKQLMAIWRMDYIGARRIPWGMMASTQSTALLLRQ